MQVSRQRALEMQEGKAADETLERRLEIMNEIVAKGLGSPANIERIKKDVEIIEMTLECRKAIHLVADALPRFKYFREMIAYAYADEINSIFDEPTDDELRAIEAETELENDVQWLYTDPRSTELHENLGTRFMISGGDVVELDAPKSQDDDDEFPF